MKRIEAIERRIDAFKLAIERTKELQPPDDKDTAHGDYFSDWHAVLLILEEMNSELKELRSLLLPLE